MLAAMPQEHERAAGGWQAEWDTLPALLELTGDAAVTAADALGDIRIDAGRMAANLEAGSGVAMSESLAAALFSQIGRPAAMALVARLSGAALADGRTLLDVAAGDPELSELLSREAVESAVNPAHALGSARHFIDRVLARWGV
jgi:3-carboxy-cis,cis-muconate cycloisomerase